MSIIHATSQVSVFNYPEHLNPFYEGDQHKRLRFWKIHKEKIKEPRRGSLSFGSLRELFPFKSFRIKSKSSTLGINKTSESPPTLRRNFDDFNSKDESRYASYDPHFRQTSKSNDFMRNSSYRNSLQNMNELSFGNRSHRYRSTTSGSSYNPHFKDLNEKYMFSGSSPRVRCQITPGSSMNSISTNPFDDDDNEEYNVKSLQKRTKKKRRAPMPPIISNGISDDSTVALRIIEKNEINFHSDELSRLTAEFENFVKSSNDKIQTIESQSVENYEGKACEEHGSNDSTANSFRKCSSKYSATAQTEPQGEKLVKSLQEAKESIENQSLLDPLMEVQRQVHSSDDSCSDQNSPEKGAHMQRKDSVDSSTNYLLRSTKPTLPAPEHSYTNRTIENIELSREVTPDYIPIPVREKFDALRIEENDYTNELLDKQEEKEKPLSKTTVTSINLEEANNVETQNITSLRKNNRLTKTSNFNSTPEEIYVSITNNQIDEKLEQPFVRDEAPIQFYEDIETVIRKKDYSFDQAEDNVQPQRPERRRSVKDIIESINRSQLLLRVNQPHSPKSERSFASFSEKPKLPSKRNVLLKLQRQATNERNLEDLLADLQNVTESVDSVARIQQ